MAIIRRLSPEGKAGLLERREKSKLRAQRKQRLYNRRYRRGIVYLSSLGIRVLYAFLFVAILLWDEEPGSISTEIIAGSHQSTLTKGGRFNSSMIYRLDFTTNRRSYIYEVGGVSRLPELDPGDKVIIERNILGRPIFFSKEGWNISYRLLKGYRLQLMLSVLTFISFFFNNGLDPIGTKLVVGVALLDIVLALSYLLG